MQTASGSGNLSSLPGSDRSILGLKPRNDLTSMLYEQSIRQAVKQAIQCAGIAKSGGLTIPFAIVLPVTLIKVGEARRRGDRSDCYLL